jgi:hypothetical protein
MNATSHMKVAARDERDADPVRGLTSDEAAARLSHIGPNEIEPPRQPYLIRTAVELVRRAAPPPTKS